jgi:hypothetical protein
VAGGYCVTLTQAKQPPAPNSPWTPLKTHGKRVVCGVHFRATELMK